MKSGGFSFFVLVLAVFAAGGCTQQAQSVTLRSLESSGAFSFLCLSTDYGARSIDDCPDTNPVDGEERHMLALVTQDTRGEVAMVDLTSGEVIDEEPTIPGFNFLPVGGKPRSIVSTPGSVATFVGVAEVGKEGIFALPTSCLSPRGAGERMRDLTVWPACRLPTAPGEMTVLVDHPVNGDGDPATPPAPRCVSSFPTATSEEIESRECPADLSQETESPGRRLLAVTLPAAGQIAIIDAQALLDRAPGSFDPCPIEKLVQLRIDIPEELPQQILPADLQLPGATRPVGFPREPVLGYETRPADVALVDDPRTGEEKLYVADQGAPVIHVLDAKNPCDLQEREPLLPMAFTDPTRVVTTKRLAASPLTTQGRRFLYAIDDFLGGVMIFDVTSGATDRTPLLRPRSALLTAEPPDRILFDAPAKDVTFALRDRVEVDPATGNQRVGIACDPDPGLDVNLPPAQYRPNPDLSEGSAPSLLRGVFGFVALSSGSVAVIDVEDFDAPCRRPVVANPSRTLDFRGCAGDPSTDSLGRTLNFFTLEPDTSETARGTVTREQSCNVVEPHRARSARFVLNNADVAGASAPSLRGLPRLLSDTARTLTNENSDEGRKNPKMLGVDFGDRPADRAQVYVGTSLYDRDSQENPLVTDPTRAEENSVVLDVTEPRVYRALEAFTATYEGTLFNERPGVARFSLRDGQARLEDGGITLCDAGVEDTALAEARGRALGVADGDLAKFGERHADYVRITSDLLDETDAYWSGAGATCGGGTEPGQGFIQCRTQLGTRKAMRDLREFVVTESSQNTLLLSPRSGDSTVSDLVACCFPQLVSYEVRASNTWVVKGSNTGYQHDVRGNPQTRLCEIDTNPLRSAQRGRAYEVSCDANSDECATLADDGTAVPRSIGLATGDDVACRVQSPTEIRKIQDSPCVFRGLASIFAIYRGQTLSERDWSFNWEVNGGFTPLSVNIALASDPNSNPQSISFSRQLGQLIIADGASKGLVTVDLSTFQSQFYY